MMHKSSSKDDRGIVVNDLFAAADDGKRMKNVWRGIKGRWLLLFCLLLGCVSALTFGVLWYQAKQLTSAAIARDIALLARIFDDINKTCGIIGFEHETNYVDFLTVRSFVGTAVGAMNMRKPRNWRGPYVTENPAVQGRLYQVVRTIKGYVLLPGNGVRLSNGLIMGKDIVITAQTDIRSLVESGQLQNRDGRPLAVLVAPLPPTDSRACKR